MNDELIAPSVPDLSDEWIAQRTEHLVEEIVAASPRRRRRFVATGAGAGVAGAAVLVALLGPWATPAFAGWSAQPSTPSSGQLAAARAACSSTASQLASVAGGAATSLAPESLNDVRGPYTLIVYGTTDPALCVSGSGMTTLHEDGGTISIGAATGGSSHQSVTNSNGITKWQGSSGAAPSPGAAVMDLSFTSSHDGDSFTVAEGSVGSQVTGATLLLKDGSSVVATVNNGLFAAWWPGQSSVTSIQVTTTAGVQ